MPRELRLTSCLLTALSAVVSHIIIGDYLISAQNTFVSLLTKAQDPTGFSVNPSGKRIMAATYKPTVRPQVGFVYPKNTAGAVVHNYDVVAIQTGFSAGWFTCGNQVIVNSLLIVHFLYVHPELKCTFL